MEMIFYRCKICGQIVAIVNETGSPLVCCGEYMEKLEPRSVDVGKEKHTPVYEIKDNKLLVQVGSLPHPSTQEHYIEWIAIVTNKGNQRKALKPGQDPKASFNLDKDEKVIDVYAYCNIHYLWKACQKDDECNK